MYSTQYYGQPQFQNTGNFNINSNYVTTNESSAGSSSVFSNQEVDYTAKIKEIEEYYLKTFLSNNHDPIDEKYVLNSQPQNCANQVDDNYLTANLYSSACSSPKQQDKFSSFNNSLFNSTDNHYRYNGLMNTSQQTNQQIESNLEVEINNAFIPNASSLPLTLENLQKFSQNSNSSFEHGAQRQLQYLQRQFQPTTVISTANVKNDNEQQINKVLYKTELCESFTTKGECKYSNKCQFAHGLHELKLKQRKNNFRTKECVNWAKLGYCPYGKRCCFKHGEDRDIQIYVKAGAIKKEEPTESQTEQPQEQAQPETSYSMPRNLHPNVKLLQRISW